MEILLDMNKLTKSIRDIKAVEHAFNKAIEDGIYELAVRSEAKLQENIMAEGVADGELPSSVNVDVRDDEISLQVNAKHADFVEYGTGLGEQHPQASKAGWAYDTNGHGEDGWWYPTEKPYGKHIYFSNKTGNWVAWTDGMDSRPFMYKTWLWASRSATNIIGKHIRRMKI